METLAEFDACCGALPGATRVVQWGGAHVWKVGGKMFAVAALDGSLLHFSFKAAAFSREMMLESGDFIPAPYLARAGWVALKPDATLSGSDLSAYLVAAHREIVARLPGKFRRLL